MHSARVQLLDNLASCLLYWDSFIFLDVVDLCGCIHSLVSLNWRCRLSVIAETLQHRVVTHLFVRVVQVTKFYSFKEALCFFFFNEVHLILTLFISFYCIWFLFDIFSESTYHISHDSSGSRRHPKMIIRVNSFLFCLREKEDIVSRYFETTYTITNVHTHNTDVHTWT